MTVQEKHLQPAGRLHGGVTALVAEHLASIAAGRNVDVSSQSIVGQTLVCNHLGSARLGDEIVAVATPEHRGRSTHLWKVDVRVAATGRLVSTCRMTAMVLNVRLPGLPSKL